MLNSLVDRQTELEKELHTINKAVNYIRSLSNNGNGNGKPKHKANKPTKAVAKKRLRVFTEEHKAKIAASRKAAWDRYKAEMKTDNILAQANSLSN